MNKGRPNRRGSLYLSVVGSAMLISIAGLAAMHVARVELRGVVGEHDALAARLAADAGVALALSEIDARDDWRTHFTARALEPADPAAFGDAEFQFVLDAGVDGGGAAIPLDDPSLTSITLRGIGRAGTAVSVAEVELAGAGEGLDALDAAVAARGDVIIGRNGFLSVGEDLEVDHPVFAGGDIRRDDNQSEVQGDAIASGVISADVTGTALEGQPGRSFPDPEAVFDCYLQNGARIDINRLPESGGTRQITSEAIGPGRNPFGDEVNEEGIYVIDCQGQELEIANSRILGTLVVINNANESSCRGWINWQPVVANYPALIIENDFTMKFDSILRLRESGGTNFNPEGVPYEGVVDNNVDDGDTYPSEINGLVYVGGRLTIEDSAFTRINGVVVCDEFRSRHAVKINYSDLFLLNPPPGFATLGDVAISIGSWRRGQN